MPSRAIPRVFPTCFYHRTSGSDLPGPVLFLPAFFLVHQMVTPCPLALGKSFSTADALFACSEHSSLAEAVVAPGWMIFLWPHLPVSTAILIPLWTGLWLGHLSFSSASTLPTCLIQPLGCTGNLYADHSVNCILVRMLLLNTDSWQTHTSHHLHHLPLLAYLKGCRA